MTRANQQEVANTLRHTQKLPKGQKGKRFDVESVNMDKELQCLCGCGQTFIARDGRQKYIAEHRFRAYESHKCPDCGSVHRVKEPRGLLANG